MHDPQRIPCTRLSPARSASCAITAGILFSLWLVSVGKAQTPGSAQPPPPGNATDTLQVNTRIVLTDVTVTDASGNPVTGLRRSQFHVFDDNRPQKLASFTAHAGGSAPPSPPATTAAGTFSNDFLLHPPSAVSVLLIDTTTIGMVDQMFLFQQLKQFVKRLPATEPVAVFNRNGQETLLLQNFTADHALLMKAFNLAIPQFPSPDAQYASEFDTMQQMAVYLEQIPGRKNILWFSGGSNLFRFMGPVAQPSMRPIYDLLETDRIALYPIDVRGLTASSSPIMMDQQMLMEQDARATGGQASYNNNGIAKNASHFVDTDGSYYTLTYSPNDLHLNGKWHSVKVMLDNPSYHLSYRRGYFDDGVNNVRPPARMRIALNADGSTRKTLEGSAQTGPPIIFQATVLPIALQALPADSAFHVTPVKPKRGMTTYTVHYVLPAADILPHKSQGNYDIDDIGAAVVGFNRLGRPIGKVQEKAVFSIDKTALRSDPTATLNFYQMINLPKGEDYVFLAVWDMTSHRFGTINLPLNVTKQSKPKKQ